VGVDPILVPASDRDLQLLPWPVEVEEIAYVHERPSNGDRDITVRAPARLRVLAEAVRVQQRRQSQGQEGKDDSACRRQKLHQKRK
jgi:hypothetical protein